VQAFYKMLPIQSKRKAAGVDEALRDAAERRATALALAGWLCYFR